ncbi:MAG TPA: RDD family protein [Oxalicibacterium sp.]|jgi:uncharacterized RDD family membrane protein YckC|nr:RDD family protein [Oxalicibacterium sp.]
MTFSTDVPSIKRRLTVMLYEGVLLFGVLMIAGLLFGVLFQQRNALYLRHALQISLFAVLGMYFVWFWIRSGQTLPMKTWRMRIVTLQGRPPGIKRAAMRYVLAWCWFLPGLLLAWALDTHGWTAVCIVVANVLAWALTARVHPSRQFLHDRIAGTQIVNVAKA